MKKAFLTVISIVISLWSSSPVLAQRSGDLVVPCAVPFYRELDFIVGDWMVYEKSSGTLVGFDRIGRTLKGCAIQQSWISLNDHFSSNFVPFRMYGKSLTAFNGTNWVQMWVDNQAGVQILKGGPEKDKFVLSSEENIGGYEYMLIWQRQEDGKLLNTHQRRDVKAGAVGAWQTLYEWEYVKNINESLFPDDEDEGN
ncbi:MAG: hypothetical protein HOH19_13415 [Kordiimonadaceae bacterium]|jgi:hypothetical protein|nr:hypothetical protein [Kordiimonadaceae bacterium]MBT6033569.1 hypothetical protein [Kordiimonadaceae bacterium]MBT7581380.1 hypothetical protein [Kordiimonadaceae bacterium]